MLHDRAVAAEAQGHASAALELWKRYDIIKGKIADKTISGKSILYAARYQSDKQRMALEEEQARRVRYYVLTWFLGGLALVFFLYILVAHFVRSRKEGEGEHKDAEKPLAPAKRPASMDDVELFEYLSEVIQREQLFLNPLLDRQTLMTRLGVSAHRVGSAFSKGSAFGSLPGYIRHLRLEYACSLLVSRPDLSVKSVGEASGFSNNSTFCSDFKNCYGVTPSDFRQGKLAGIS
jgi:AraC-like DNA-binding protein